jgi:alkylated DNA repair dioxygenase AlkB
MHLPGFFDNHHLNLLPKDGSLEYLYPFFPEDQFDDYFAKLYSKTEWVQDEIKIYDKVHPLPRLVAWYDESSAWPGELLEIKKFVEDYMGESFNTVLLNLYRDERDHVSWHSDKFKHPDDVKTIVSLSFGETRKFQVKHKKDKRIKVIGLELMPGSLVVMKKMQEQWLHRIALTTEPKGPRINLTFRNIKRY